jgi:hypothetical protein
LNAAVVELLAELLDEAVPLGEMHRYVVSVRATLGERERGIPEHTTPACEATRAAARLLVERLAAPLPLVDDEDDLPEYDGPAPEARDEDGAPLDMTPKPIDEDAEP